LGRGASGPRGSTERPKSRSYLYKLNKEGLVHQNMAEMLSSEQVRPLPRVIILQKDKSQLDEPVYHYVNAMDGALLKVLYTNEYGVERVFADDELELVPNFLDKFAAVYEKDWVQCSRNNVARLIKTVIGARPKIVLAADLDLRTRVLLSTIGKSFGFLVAIRSDKNEISQNANTGARLLAERQAYWFAFSALFGVSELTFDYYNWKDQGTRCLFPYATDERKFTAKAGERQDVRHGLGLKDDNYLFLSAVKFHPRENPFGIIQAFCQIAPAHPGARLIVLGSGPQHAIAQELVPCTLRHRVSFPGYIPYAKLQDYFFAADAFVHLPEREPWGVSVQDALFCKLPVIASDKVGSAIRLMQGQAQRFIVKHTDLRSAAELMRYLIQDPSQKDNFLEPHRIVREMFTAERVAQNLVKFFQGVVS
jgi:glycosyltransferase involved in cell wall biosynthesis